MYKNLVRGMTFEISDNKRLGTMRIDWYDGKLFNQWNPTNLIIELNKESRIDLKNLQEELNYIQFTIFPTFKQIEKLCNGTGYDKEQIFTSSLEHFNYAIRLIPIKDAYSYIYAYLK